VKAVFAMVVVFAVLVCAALHYAPRPSESALTVSAADLAHPWHNEPAVKSTGHSMARVFRPSATAQTEPRPRQAEIATDSAISLRTAAPARIAASVTVLRI
jgi:hypothetical protein